jgi:UDP-3-O-[3-hydroxymyristoyl] N-acetylglucosamine deacetylase
MTQQKTIQNIISCRGVGLHTGKMIHLRFIPAKQGEGIIFVRKDMGCVEIPADAAHVLPSQFSTIIREGEASVQTVEHLLAAVSALGIDNLRIELDGPEIPAMDGSAAPFIALLLEAGTVEQSRPRSFIEILKPIRVSEGKKSVTIRPGSSFEVSVGIDFEHAVIAKQSYRYWHGRSAFIEQIASARTFGFLKDIDALKAQGLAMGGSLDNAVVIGEDAVLNTQGLRFPDEFVRHKVLDLIGDLVLLGMPILGRVEAHCSGHKLHAELIKEIIRNKQAWRVTNAPSCEEKRTTLYSAPVFQAIAATA